MVESWFPRNCKIADDTTLGAVLFGGQNWQIFSAPDDKTVLVATESISLFWMTSGLLDSTILRSFQFGVNKFFFLQSPNDMMLTPISFAQEIVTYEDGKSFALALAASRKLVSDVSFSDGVFVECYTRLLPDTEEKQSESDEILLGRWLSRGTDISAGSIQRMLQLLPTVTDKGLEDILKAARISCRATRKKQKKNVEQAPKKESSGEQGLFVLPGRSELETFFRDYVIDIVQNPDDYKNMGIDFPTAFILQGPPGCGKTFAVEKLVDYLDWPCFYIDSGSIGSPFIHETSKKISAVFEEAIEKAPSVLIIDEMESFLSNREGAGVGNGHHVEEVAEFLRKIPEATKNHVLVVAMTNMIATIDPAIRRKGRFDHIIEVGMPSKEEIVAVLKNGLEKVPHDDNIDLDKISDALAEHPMSDVAFILREAARITAKSHQKAISGSAFDAVLASFGQGQKKEHRPMGFGGVDGDEK